MLRAYIRGLLYIGRAFTRPIAGLAIRLAAILAIGYIASTIGVTDCAGVL